MRVLQAGHPEQGTYQDAKHGRGGRDHPQQDVPGHDPDLERRIGTVDIEAPYGTERPRFGRYRWLVLPDPEHGNARG